MKRRKFISSTGKVAASAVLVPEYLVGLTSFISDSSRRRLLANMRYDNDSFITPLINARLGSGVSINNNGDMNFRRSLFDQNISTMNYGSNNMTFLTGQSRYIHTDRMNQGSFGISGSYGFSGLAKVQASVSGYLGNAVTNSSREVKINYNATMNLGNQVLDTYQLTIQDLVNAMAKNPRAKLLRVLDNYNAAVDIKNDSQDADLYRNAIAKWGKSVEDFYRSYGTGVVIGVHWGAIGTVEMSISDKKGSSAWNYGVEGSLSVSGLIGSMGIKAAYDGNNSESKGELQASAKSSSLGNVINEKIGNIKSQFETDVVSNINSYKFDKMESAGNNLTVPQDLVPAIPKVISIAERNEVLKKLETLKNLNELEDIEKGWVEIDNPNDPGPLPSEEPSLFSNIVSGATSILSSLWGGSETSRIVNQESIIDQPALNNDRENEEREPYQEDESFGTLYTPLGVSVCNWADIFPWLVNGIDNSLGDLSTAQVTMAWRMMIQDFLGLSIMYQCAAEAKLEQPIGATWEVLSASFSQRASILQENWNGNKMDVIHEVYNKLSREEKIIYDKWSELGFLRNADLGLGVVDISVGEVKTIKGSKGLYDGPYKDTDGHGVVVPDPKWSIDVENCNFDPEKENYVAFSQSVKVFPIIIPDEQASVCTFNQLGFFGIFVHISPAEISDPNYDPRAYSGFFSKKHFDFNAPGSFSFNSICEIDKENKNLKLNKANGKNVCSFYPIPMSAAEGLPNTYKWRGGTSGIIGMNSFNSLKQNVELLEKELNRKGSWTYQSENWKDVDWYRDLGLDSLNVIEQYVGLIPNDKAQIKVYPK